MLLKKIGKKNPVARALYVHKVGVKTMERGMGKAEKRSWELYVPELHPESIRDVL